MTDLRDTPEGRALLREGAVRAASYLNSCNHSWVPEEVAKRLFPDPPEPRVVTYQQNDTICEFRRSATDFQTVETRTRLRGGGVTDWRDSGIDFSLYCLVASLAEEGEE